jgi:hypothetical protein
MVAVVIGFVGEGDGCGGARVRRGVGKLNRNRNEERIGMKKRNDSQARQSRAKE